MQFFFLKTKANIRTPFRFVVWRRSFRVCYCLIYWLMDGLIFFFENITDASQHRVRNDTRRQFAWGEDFSLPQCSTFAIIDFRRENKTLPQPLSALQVKLASVPALPVILYPEDGPSHTMEPEIVVGGENRAKPTTFSIKSLPGPNLNEVQESLAPLDLSFENDEVPAGKVTFYVSFLYHHSACHDLYELC